MRVAKAMIVGMLGAFLIVTGVLGGGTRLAYSSLGFYAPVVHDLGPRTVLTIIGVLFVVSLIYLPDRESSPVERESSPESTFSLRSPAASSGAGLLSFFISAVILVALILATGVSSPERRADAVVKRFIAAINLRDYADAWAVGGKNVGIPYRKFVAGFATTAYDRLTIQSVSGNIVTIQLVAHQTDCTVKTYQGKYTVDDGVITHFGVRQVGAVTSSRADPAATVREFIAAINRGDYAEAWAVGGKNAGTPYRKFVAGFATTAYDRLTIQSVSGNIVTIQLVAHQTDGTVKTYQGGYMVEDCILTQFNIRQIR